MIPSPRQLRPHPTRRTQAVVAILACVWGLLALRLVQLQWAGRHDLAKQASRQRAYLETIPARPGEILDRRGRLLATTITMRSLYIVPNRISNGWRVAVQLGETLQLDPDRLLERIAANRDKQFLWVKRRLSDAESEQVKELQLPPGTWGFRDEFLRRYPQTTLAAHVIGLRDIDGRGRGGVEQSLDAILGGRPGQRRLERDAHGKVMAIHDQIAQSPSHGRCVVLTLDAVIQLHAERELDRLMAQWKPQGAAAIVLDPKTGEVLAMASRPTFDPNMPDAVPEFGWSNRAVAAMYEPGSTIKPLVVSWALEKDVIQRDETFDCEMGVYRMGRRLLHDHHPYGTLNVTDILVKSSNIGMAKIGQRLTNRGLYDLAVAFGLGRRTGIEIPGELSGVVRSLRDWNAYSTGSVPMGHEISVTPIQLIAAHAALANDGALISPRLIKHVARDSVTADEVILATLNRSGGVTVPVANGDWIASAVVSPVVHPDIARWMIQGPLTDVVARGTGRKAKIDGYEVFGKTGTSQKTDPETGKYSTTHHVSSFICGAPAEDPQVLVLVVADDPSVSGSHYGGIIAAPFARAILQKTLVQLRVPPEQPPVRAAARIGP